ncbi:MAG: NAD-binding protein [Drouetiella hepatica Uher 2000/2452]|jgi:Trk K+ transport system NAD-binding subunit|uniref:NAD-binding protein n=1 Tax=Drouetiella hepatica Uher 2000/2452 TaxID=904376 RepID=A0A951QAD7_9CYAN|nr:NAD-binding protein [Drouetiella hepatica Uher 2000/2452]
MPSPSKSLDLPYGSQLDRFLVCGLGSLGQHCVAELKEYGAIVSAIVEAPPKSWEIPELPQLLEEVLIGDCRLETVLKQARIHDCRTILLVTGNERVNTEAALAARSLNPKVRLIVRSDKQNLNQLLGQSLGNFAAFEPTQLSASAFALSALSVETLGYFKLEKRLLRVVKYQVEQGDRWCDRWWVHGLNSRSRRLLSHTPLDPPSDSPLNPLHPEQFHQWNSEAVLKHGDTVVYVEVMNSLDMGDMLARPTHDRSNDHDLRTKPSRWQKSVARISQLWIQLGHWGKPGKTLAQILRQFWRSTEQYQTQRVAIVCGITLVFMWLLGILLYRMSYPTIGLAEAFYAPIILLLGGYGDLFGSVDFANQPAPAAEMPGWLRLFSLTLTLAGTAFVGVLYALLTEALLTSRFMFFSNRDPVPHSNHVVLVGLGRVGQGVATLLQELKQPLVAITIQAIDSSTLPRMPIIMGDLPHLLAKVNLETAKSIVVVTGDDIQNLELGLMAHTINPNSRLVIRTYDQHFSNSVTRLFPYAQVLCGSALSAEVFVAAAFGENIISLFHFNQKTVLVTEYSIEAGDTLNGKLLSEIAYGYSVVPVLYQRNSQELPELMPSEDIRLYGGARLIVLATSQSLQWIERGELAPRQWQVRIEQALNSHAVIEGANKIALVSGCNIGAAKKLMVNLPATLELPLYEHQAQRLVRKLNESNVAALALRL